MTPGPESARAGLPELGPLLGRLTEMAARAPGSVPGLDPVRLELVSGLFEVAADARRALAAGDEVGARARLDRAAWLELWHRAVAATADRTLEAIDARLDRAAARSAAPRRRRRSVGPSDEDRAVIRARLDAAGIPLEQVLSRPLAGQRDWPAAIRRAGAALEEAWDELERTASVLGAEWDPAVSRLERWRPPMLLYAVPAGLLVLLALGLGLAIGGYLPRPPWLDPVAAWFWTLPWP
jgi:hypothetical protein